MNNKKIDQNKHNENLRVLVRVRPFFQTEVFKGFFLSTTEISPDNKFMNVYEYFDLDKIPSEQMENYIQDPNSYRIHQFQFDYIFPQDCTQQKFYEKSAQELARYILEGFNATIIAYGQTGSGKTFSVQGDESNEINTQGIIPRAIKEIFDNILQQKDKNSSYSIKASYLQIYQENIQDLLIPSRNKLQIRENTQRGIFIEGLSTWLVKSYDDVMKLLKKGQKSRKTSSTVLNDVSSRSHAIFQIIIEKLEEKQSKKTFQKSTFNFVDLAGSERLRVTQAKGKRLEECKYINSSLSSLGYLISQLNNNKKKQYLSYRDSKLTRILQNSLGGNCKTTIITCVSPAVDSFFETLSSLRFACKAKKVQNFVEVNKKNNTQDLQLYEEEINTLKNEVKRLNQNLIDRSIVIKIEAEKNQALKDKEEALFLLETQQQEFLREHNEKKQLLHQIELLKQHIIESKKKQEKELPVIMEQNESTFIKQENIEKENYSLKNKLEKQQFLIQKLQNKLQKNKQDQIQMIKELETYEMIVENLRKKNKLLKNQIENNETQKINKDPKYINISSDEESSESYEKIKIGNTEQFVLKQNNEQKMMARESVNEIKYKVDSVIRELTEKEGNIAKVAENLIQIQDTLEQYQKQSQKINQQKI